MRWIDTTRMNGAMRSFIALHVVLYSSIYRWCLWRGSDTSWEKKWDTQLLEETEGRWNLGDIQMTIYRHFFKTLLSEYVCRKPKIIINMIEKISQS